VPRLVAYVFIAAVLGFTVAVSGGRDGRSRCALMTDGCVSARWRISTSPAPPPACCLPWDGSSRLRSIALSCGLVVSDLPIVVAAGAAATLICTAARRLMRPLCWRCCPIRLQRSTFALIEVIGGAWFALINPAVDRRSFVGRRSTLFFWQDHGQDRAVCGAGARGRRRHQGIHECFRFRLRHPSPIVLK
jgi:hypothetical protein